MACQPVEVKLPYRDEVNGGLLCTTTDMLFGPLFESLDEANEFCDWLKDDPRRLASVELWDRLLRFRSERKAVNT